MLVGIFLVAFYGPQPLTSASPRWRASNFAQYGTGIARWRDSFILLFLGSRSRCPGFPFQHVAARRPRRAPTAAASCWLASCSRWAATGLLRCASRSCRRRPRLQWLLIILAVVNSIYGALVALSQTDLKKMISNFSISHMGYVILGIAAAISSRFQAAFCWS